MNNPKRKAHKHKGLYKTSTTKFLLEKDKYPDFEKVVGDIGIKNFPNVVSLLGDYVDNSHDVLYELGKDRI